MRILLAIAGIVVGTGLFSHGLVLEDAAAAALKEAGASPSKLAGVAKDYPYSTAAATARSARFDRWKEAPPAASLSEWNDLIVGNAERGFVEDMPWIRGRGACALGLGLLILVLFMPRQRLRGMALTLIIFGGVAVHAWFLDDAHMAGLIDAFTPASHALAEMPRIGAGMIFLAGCLLALPRRRLPAG